MQLYMHYQSKALPLLTTPPEAKCKDVALLSLTCQDWPLALAAAQDVSATNAELAASIVAEVLDVMEAAQSSASIVATAAAGMPLLHAVGRHKDAVKVDWQIHEAPVNVFCICNLVYMYLAKRCSLA